MCPPILLVRVRCFALVFKHFKSLLSYIVSYVSFFDIMLLDSIDQGSLTHQYYLYKPRGKKNWEDLGRGGKTNLLNKTLSRIIIFFFNTRQWRRVWAQYLLYVKILLVLLSSRVRHSACNSIQLDFGHQLARRPYPSCRLGGHLGHHLFFGRPRSCCPAVYEYYKFMYFSYLEQKKNGDNIENWRLHLR